MDGHYIHVNVLLWWWRQRKEASNKKACKQRTPLLSFLSTGLTKYDGGDDVDESVFKFAQERAAKLITNHNAIIKDCTRQEPPLSQKEISCAYDETTADALLWCM
jgi:hypothetical protein